jgi:hypothetical protein
MRQLPLFQIVPLKLPPDFSRDTDRCARCLTAIHDEFDDRCRVCGGEEVL